MRTCGLVAGQSDRNRSATCHLLHLENEVGPYASAEDIVRWWSDYCEAIGVHPGDMIVAGVSQFAARTFCFALKGENIVWRVGRGPGGGKRALLDSFDLEHVAVRCRRLVIASGDHCFVSLAREAGSRRMQVHLVAGSGWVSRELEEACSTRQVTHQVHRYRPQIVPVLQVAETAA